MGECLSEIDETLIEYVSEDQIFHLLKNCSTRDPYLYEIPYCDGSYILSKNLPAEVIAKQLGCAEVNRIGGFFNEFEVRWRAGENWCSDCIRSGGVCGYNSSLPGDPLCLCSEGASSAGGICQMVGGN